MTILDELCIGGQFYFKSAKLMREAYLVNGMLTNSEVWYNVTETEMKELEEVDESLLRNILKAHTKTPIEALYLELGCLPLRYIVMARRLNYLHYLLNLKDDELLHKFFKAQEEFPNKNDWILTAKENLEHLGMDIDLNEIKRKSKIKFKKEIKQKIKIAALKYLQNISERHSKMDSLRYKDIFMQKYLISSLIDKHEGRQIFKYRTKMSRFNANFSNGAPSLECPLCKKENSIDDEAHNFNCEVMQTLLPETINKNPNDIYSNDVEVMKNVAKIFTKILELRSDLNID